MKWYWIPITLLLSIVVGVIVGGVVVLWGGLPEVMSLEEYRPPISTVVYAADNSALGELAAEHRTPVTFKEMPPKLIQAVLAIEDHKYFEHSGINFGRIFKALVVDIFYMEAKQGASTITQQLTKILFLTPEKTISRKLREAIIAFELERKYTKEEILTFYLNQIYLGNGAYGVASGAKAYFEKNLKDLTLAECALLAALPKNPSKYNPLKNAEAAKSRRDTVINRMLELEWITQEEAKKALAEPVPTEPPKRPPVLGAYFVEAVRRDLVKAFGEDEVYRGGLKVYTTLDTGLQATAEEALKKGLAEVNKNHLIQKSPLQGALVALDPATGAVLAHIGGRNWRESSFDRSYQNKRQIGSTFKPFIYIAAFEQGLTQSDTVMDSPVSFQGGKAGEAWRPENYDHKFQGVISYRQALSQSRNIPAIRVYSRVGTDAVKSVTDRLGLPNITGEGLATALGVGTANLYELTSAYSSFVSGGLRPEPYRIRAVINQDGVNVWPSPPPPKRALSPEIAYLISDALKGVVESGTARAAKALGFQVAGKTGTTDEQRDAAFIGFSSKLTIGVWLGRDDNTPIGRGVTGGVAALPIWMDVMKKSADNGPPPPWEVPQGIIFDEIDMKSGRPVKEHTEGTAYAAFLNKELAPASLIPAR